MTSAMMELSLGNSPIMGREHRKFTFSRVTVQPPNTSQPGTHIECLAYHKIPLVPVFKSHLISAISNIKRVAKFKYFTKKCR